MALDPTRPYNQLPPLPPRVNVETPAVLRKTISAGRELAELKGVGGTIPDQAMLINTLVLQEARASSEVENIVTTNDALFRAFTASTSQIDPVTKEVLRYRQALWEGFNKLSRRPLFSTNMLIRVVQTIKEEDAGIRTVGGTVIGNRRTGEVIYTPPEGEDVIRRKLKELEGFVHAEDALDPLIKLAMIHYQFEAIHPFPDGNGRTGRILNILFLVLRGLLDLPVLYLSKYIIEHRRLYYRLLRGVTEAGEWEPWVLYVLEAVEATARYTREKITAIRALMQETQETCRKRLPKRVYSKDLIEIIFRQPYTKGQFLVDAGIAERKTAADYLKELQKIGVLRSHKVGKENLYLNVKLYDLLSH